MKVNGERAVGHGLSIRMVRDLQERGWIGSLVGELTTTLVGVALIVAAVLLSVSGGGPQLAPTSHSYRS